MKLLTAVVVSAMVAAACGGGPTAPTASSAAALQQTGPTPAPTPTPQPTPTPTPSPSPTPPVPTPGSPEDSWHGPAITQDALWYDGKPLVPQTFTVKFDRTTITFGDLSAPVLLWQTTDGSGLIGVFARPNGLNLQIVFDPADGKGMWTLSGIPGQASGTLTVVR